MRYRKFLRQSIMLLILLLAGWVTTLSASAAQSNRAVQSGQFAYNCWKAYFTNDVGWDNVMVWVWDNDNDAKNYTGGTWPGAQCAYETIGGNNYWTYTFCTEDSLAAPMIIFNNGGYGDQTKDLSFVNNGVYSYNGFTGQNIVEDDSNQIKAPVLSQTSCNFYKSFELTITDVNDDPTIIKYTLDGSEPNADNGQTYTAPVLIPEGNSVTIKAVCINENEASAVTKATYTFIAKHLLSVIIPNKSCINYVYYSSNTEYGEWYDDNSTYITDGDNVYIGFSLNSGYKCKTVNINNVPQNVSSNYFEFVMPSNDVEIVIDAEFDPSSPSDPQPGEQTKKYNLSLVCSPIGAASLSGAGTYTEGSSVYIYASNNSGYVFTGWSKDGEAISGGNNMSFTMPASDVVLTANFAYNPSNPTDPQQPTLKHPLTVIASPTGAGTFSTSGSECTYGQEYYVYAYPQSGYRFKGWIVNGVAQEEASTTYRGIMSDAGAQVVGLFVFDPSSPSNPGINYYNPTTGQVIIDDFTPGSLSSAIREVLGSDNYTNVRSLTVKGEMNLSDYNIFSNLSKASTFDLSRTTGVTAIPSYTFQNSIATVISLPSSISSIGNYAFRSCENLTSLIVFTQEPLVCSSLSFADFEYRNKCKLYVPESSVDLYSNADYWRDFIIMPISNDANILEVSPDDSDGWNDISRPHRLTINGEYFSSLGLSCRIEYSVDDFEVWGVMASYIESGDKFSETITVMFNPNLPLHTINLRAVDAGGNISLLTPITYRDVNSITIEGMEDKFYCWGDPITQTSIECEELLSGQYAITNYKNNINVGVASFNVEGVFPYSIGRKKYEFFIEPLQLSGNIEFVDNASYEYSGEAFTPEWHFMDDRQNTLVAGTDYDIAWLDNIYPGVASLVIKGINNFTGTLKNTFIINKVPLTPALYSINVPAEDITFDNKSHAASSSKAHGVGEISFYYAKTGSDNLSTIAPTSVGEYDVYADIAEGDIYLSSPLAKVGFFTIYEFDDEDWQAVQALKSTLTLQGWNNPWETSDGVSAVSSFNGLIIEKGHVVGVNLISQGISGTFPLELLAFKNLKSLDIAHNAFCGALERVSEIIYQNLVVTSNVESIDISHNEFEGNIGAFAAAFPSLKSLNASYNKIVKVYPMIASSVDNLELRYQTIDQIIDIDLSNLSTEIIAQKIPHILLYDHTSQSYDKPIRLKCYADDGWTMILGYENEKFSFSNFSEQNVYYGNSGDILSVIALSQDGDSEEAHFKIKLSFGIGDANFDGNVSILDLQATILYAFDDYTENLFNFTAANTYADNLINVQDVICTANILLLNNSFDDQICRKNILGDRSLTQEASIFIDDDTLYLNSSHPVAAIDLKIDGNAEWCISQYGFTAASSKKHLVAYSLAGLTLPQGIIPIATVSKDSRILKCVLSDEHAQLIPVSTSHDTSDIETLKDTDGERALIFDAAGRNLNSLGNGVNIVIDSKGAKKILKSK